MNGMIFILTQLTLSLAQNNAKSIKAIVMENHFKHAN